MMPKPCNGPALARMDNTNRSGVSRDISAFGVFAVIEDLDDSFVTAIDFDL